MPDVQSLSQSAEFGGTTPVKIAKYTRQKPGEGIVRPSAPLYYTSSYFTVQEGAHVSTLVHKDHQLTTNPLNIATSAGGTFGRNYRERHGREDRTRVVNKYTCLTFVLLFCTVVEDDINTRENICRPKV